MPGSSGGFAFGEQLTAVDLNNAFSSKQDFVGQTGVGPLVAQTNAQLITPDLGVPSAIDLTHATNFPASAIIGLGANVAAALALPLNGTGALVGTTGAALITPNLGTPSAGVLTNCTALPVGAITGLGAGVAAALAAAVTGAGGIVLANGPTLTAPNLGTPTAINLTNAVAPTAAPGDATTKPASTAFVTAAVAAGLAGVTGAAAAFRNRIINGDMRVDQRNNGAQVTISPGGTPVAVDRWRIPFVGTGQLKAQRAVVTGWAPTTYTRSALQVFTSVVQAAPAAADAATINQVIEGINTSDFYWGTANAQPITVSFVADVTVAGDYGVNILSSDAGLSYVHKIALPANLPTKVSFTVPGPTTGTWNTDSTVGLYLRFCMMAGANYRTATLDAWQAGNLLAPSTQVNMLTVANQSFYLTDVQVEVGATASAFERRSVAQEIQLCQRYYFTSGAIVFSGYGAAAGQIYTPMNYPVVMRATPAVTYDPATSYINGSAVTAWANATATTLTTQFTLTALGYGLANVPKLSADAEL